MHDVITFNCEHIMQWKIVLHAILKFFDGFDKFTDFSTPQPPI